MTIKYETSLSSFEFWGGAKDNARHYTMDEMNEIENIFDELFPEGMTATDVNDIFWFDFDGICEWIGLDPEEVAARE